MVRGRLACLLRRGWLRIAAITTDGLDLRFHVGTVRERVEHIPIIWKNIIGPRDPSIGDAVLDHGHLALVLGPHEVASRRIVVPLDNVMGPGPY